MTKPAFCKPKRLMPGGTIGIVAPSGSFEREAFDRGIEVISRLGFTTKLAEGIFTQQGYLAGADHHRLAQLNAMFADPQVDAIMCARGGFGAMKLLSGLDYASIGRLPKAFIGFSDITAVHQALYQNIGLVTFHGPVVTTLGTADDATLGSWKTCLTGEQPMALSAQEARTIVPGNAEGIVRGGNLATLCHLVGTAFSPVFSDAILVIEEVNEPLYRIDRMLTQMKLAACFHGLAGVVMGDFSGCGAIEDVDHLMKDCFQEFAVPVAAGFAFGHSQTNMTIPLGVTARLDADSGVLEFLEPVVEDAQ